MGSMSILKNQPNPALIESHWNQGMKPTRTVCGLSLHINFILPFHMEPAHLFVTHDIRNSIAHQCHGHVRPVFKVLMKLQVQLLVGTPALYQPSPIKLYTPHIRLCGEQCLPSHCLGTLIFCKLCSSRYHGITWYHMVSHGISLEITIAYGTGDRKGHWLLALKGILWVPTN